MTGSNWGVTSLALDELRMIQRPHLALGTQDPGDATRVYITYLYSTSMHYGTLSRSWLLSCVMKAPL